MNQAGNPEPHEVDKKRLLSRARRMEGQASGVVRMIEAQRSCGDILQQIVALTSAAEELAVLLIQDHVKERWSKQDTGDKLVRELGSLLRRVMRR